LVLELVPSLTQTSSAPNGIALAVVIVKVALCPLIPYLREVGPVQAVTALTAKRVLVVRAAKTTLAAPALSTVMMSS